jgi:hypothetical protein
MYGLPDGEIHVHYAPRLGRIGRAGNGDVEAVTPASDSDKPKFLQEFLQVENEAWSIDEYVQAAAALRSGRNGVAFSHCGEETGRVKSGGERVPRSATSFGKC